VSPFVPRRVREALNHSALSRAIGWVPATTVPYLIGRLAVQALQAELDTTPKPGLVDRHDNGAHTDMDYRLMCTSIQALRPYLTRLAIEGSQCGRQGMDLDVERLRQLGIDGEAAMLQATGGVNTHRGALFAMGLVAAVSAWLTGRGTELTQAALSQHIAAVAQRFARQSDSHGGQATATYHVAGALDMAREGYRDLFESWLGYYRECIAERHDEAEQARVLLLLRIMAELDDTNVIYRTGSLQGLRDVQQQARTVLDGCQQQDASQVAKAVSALNEQYVERNISPGGSADMMALTLLVYAILN